MDNKANEEILRISEQRDELMILNANYKILLEMADVPELLVQHPELLSPSPLLEDDIKSAKMIITDNVISKHRKNTKLKAYLIFLRELQEKSDKLIKEIELELKKYA